MNREQLKMMMEQAIDESDVWTVVSIIGEICSNKAYHIRESYSDNRLAARWDVLAKKFNGRTL